MAYTLPTIIYGIDNKPLGRVVIANKNTFTVWSYKNFDVSVVSGKCTVVITSRKLERLGTVKPTETVAWEILDNNYSIKTGTMFTGKQTTNSYTLVIESDCVVNIGGNPYKFVLRLDNEFTEENDDKETSEWPKQHYNDLLVNYFLPTWEELEPCYFGSNRRDLVKRMLLDFRKIVIRKGTVESIKLFFKFIDLKNIKIVEEYAHKNDNGTISKTVQPDKLVDWKTGYYHVLFNNFEQEDGNAGLDRKNMPLRKLYITDTEEFFKQLVRAIALAEKYFLLPEQQISFFGMGFSSNAPMFQPVQGWGQKIYKWYPHFFQRGIDINIYRKYDTEHSVYLVKNKRQLTSETFLSEVKAVFTTGSVFDLNTLSFIEREVSDDEAYNGDIHKLKSFFGNILHIDVQTTSGYYAEVTITSRAFPERFIRSDKQQLVDGKLHLEVATIDLGTYDITVNVWDNHNNRETYNYEYTISADKYNIDIEAFSSAAMDEDNGMTLEPSSPALQNFFNVELFDYILNLENVPDDLKEYYDMNVMPKVEIRTNKRYLLPDFNQYNDISEITETLPLEFIDSWVDICTIPYDATKELKLRIYDGNTCRHEIIDYDQIASVASETTDKIFVTLVDVTEERPDGETYTVPYYLLMTTEVGIDLKLQYDFVLVDKDGSNPESIYDNKNVSIRRLPLNHDIPLFFRASRVVPDFKHYVSGAQYAGENQYVILKSTMPRLINITDQKVTTNELRFGDVILCRLDKRYVVGATDIVWNVRDSFTKEILFSTTDEALKYRISEVTIYDVEVTFNIRNAVYTIYRNSLFTSYNAGM